MKTFDPDQENFCVYVCGVFSRAGLDIDDGGHALRSAKSLYCHKIIAMMFRHVLRKGINQALLCHRKQGQVCLPHSREFSRNARR